MSKIKLTKSELKLQRDALKQFKRFLPTLLLKKQQLQGELEKCRERQRKITHEQNRLLDGVKSWRALFGEDAVVPFLEKQIELEHIEKFDVNIAGVFVPECKSIRFTRQPLDFYFTDSWIDDAIDTLEKVVEFQIRRSIIDEQYRLLFNELRLTSQRVNLFEKVKIPTCQDNIRKIQIYLGDQDATAVGRSKIAKKKLQELNA